MSDSKKSVNAFEKNKKISMILIIGIILFAGIVMFGGHRSKKSAKTTIELRSKYQALSTNMEIISKKMDERISNLEKKTANQSQEIKDIKSNVKSIQSEQNQLVHAVQKMQNQMEQITQTLMSLNRQLTETKFKNKQAFKQPPARITVVKIPQANNSNAQQQSLKKKVNKTQYYVKLPDASIVEGTVVSGIYAPVNNKMWLPTLININQAFYGPNNTRIPLKGCKILARAQGDYTTVRADIKLYELSCVLPNGIAKHYRITGYVSDSKDGAFGVKGNLISVTGKYIAGTFLTSFMSGASQAIAQAQTTSTTTTNGDIIKNVTGNVGRYTAFSGLSSGLSQTTSYYQNMLSKMVDMIYVPTGRHVWLIIQKGAVIKGYKPQIYSSSFGGVD